MQGLIAQHAPEISPWLLVAAAAAAVLVALLIGSALLRRRTPHAVPPRPAELPAAPPASQSSQHRSVERDIKTLMHELSEMTRRATAQLDARSAKLEQLIREADQRLARLGATPSSSSNGDGSTQDASPLSLSASSSSLSSSSETTIADAASEDVIDPRHVEIYTLCEQGLSTQQIADRLHRPSGEVELIIALRPGSRALESSRD